MTFGDTTTTRIIQQIGAQSGGSHTFLWSRYERYYIGDQPPLGLTTEQQNDPDYKELWKPVNFCAPIINEPAGYISEAYVTVDHENAAVKRWAESFYKKRLKRIMAQVARYQALYGEAYIYLNVDDEGVRTGIKARAMPPYQNGELRVKASFRGDDEEEVEEAQIAYYVQQAGQLFLTERRVDITDTRIKVMERQRSGAGSTSPSSMWLDVSSDPNEYGLVPLIRVQNHQDGSDLVNITDLQDDLNMGMFDLRVTRKYHAFPVLTSSSKIATTVRIGPGSMIEGADINRLAPGDLSQILSGNASVVQSMALIAESLLIANIQGVQMSGIALERLQDSFTNKLMGKCNMLASSLALALALAGVMMARSPELFKLENPTDEQGNLIPVEAFLDTDYDVKIIPKSTQEKAEDQRASDKAFVAGGTTFHEYQRERGRDADDMWDEKIKEDEQSAKISGSVTAGKGGSAPASGSASGSGPINLNA